MERGWRVLVSRLLSALGEADVSHRPGTCGFHGARSQVPEQQLRDGNRPDPGRCRPGSTDRVARAGRHERGVPSGRPATGTGSRPLLALGVLLLVAGTALTMAARRAPGAKPAIAKRAPARR
jgi:hypothetical protein